MKFTGAESQTGAHSVHGRPAGAYREECTGRLDAVLVGCRVPCVHIKIRLFEGGGSAAGTESRLQTDREGVG